MEPFSHGKVKNYWGGSSNVTTRLFDVMHYQGLLRVVRRDGGVRIYAVHQHEPRLADADICRTHLDTLVDIAIRICAPLPARSLPFLLRRLRYAARNGRTK